MPPSLPPPKSHAEQIADSLYQARRFDDLPQSIQLVRVNWQVMRWELSNADGMRKIVQIRARFNWIILDI